MKLNKPDGGSAAGIGSGSDCCSAGELSAGAAITVSTSSATFSSGAGVFSTALSVLVLDSKAEIFDSSDA